MKGNEMSDTSNTFPPGFEEEILGALAGMSEEELETALKHLLDIEEEETGFDFSLVDKLPAITITLEGREYGVLATALTEWGQLISEGHIQNPGNNAALAFASLVGKIDKAAVAAAKSVGVDMDECVDPECKVHRG